MDTTHGAFWGCVKLAVVLLGRIELLFMDGDTGIYLEHQDIMNIKDLAT